MDKSAVKSDQFYLPEDYHTNSVSASDHQDHQIFSDYFTLGCIKKVRARNVLV